MGGEEKDKKARKNKEIEPEVGESQKGEGANKEGKDTPSSGSESHTGFPGNEDIRESGSSHVEEGGSISSAGVDEISVLRSRIEELDSENKELLDRLVRLKADFENFRKRMVREQTRILETAAADIVKKLLPVLDDLERALNNSNPDQGSDAFRQGVEMVYKKLIETLKKEGLEEISPEGQIFDPHHHEAMMVVERDDCPEGTITEVVNKGYRFRGVLLRPAMVKVSCAVKKDDDSPDAD